ncbi:hypothetical protein RHODO2019_18335 (plasmid) [Rhodococcus antarcticus]|uniref:Uncharacterized protein n=1 Tax=Rhodococcus antarcticus TaxID=2987751 RepID=A0ABY6P596_9NOCA|nr:hypothetical protein [Rhodococcus antarcticus]UZJ26842.1 hypothetical protein RHODO2019_18335 [Rhodococcus antarcticus]
MTVTAAAASQATVAVAVTAAAPTHATVAASAGRQHRSDEEGVRAKQLGKKRQTMGLTNGLTRWGVATPALVAIGVLGWSAYSAATPAAVEGTSSGKGLTTAASQTTGLTMDDHHALGLAIWGVAAFMVAILLLLEFSASPRQSSNKFGFLDSIVGVDGRISTSKTVVFIWTLELAAALILLSGIVVWDRNPAVTADHVFGTGDWNAYSLLLGGPFAAAVIAKGITASTTTTTTTTTTNPIPKSNTQDVTPLVSLSGMTDKGAALKDITSNDDGSTSLADSQYVIFSLVAMVYFFGAFVGNIVDYTRTTDVTKIHLGLPTIPSALLGLTSLAALTYVGNKAAATQGLNPS